MQICREKQGRNSSLDVAGRFLIYILPTGPSVGFSGITTAITQVAANKLKIKTDVKCDLGSSHCYPARFAKLTSSTFGTQFFNVRKSNQIIKV